jgi:putative alpha-1,2-mannosidase
MSAWYLFTALGFYPVAPGSGQYSLGSPVVKTATIKLENGRTLTIEARNQGERNVYVSNVIVNGRKLERNYLRFSEINGGGRIVFEMLDSPVKSRIAAQ